MPRQDAANGLSGDAEVVIKHPLHKLAASAKLRGELGTCATCNTENARRTPQRYSLISSGSSSYTLALAVAAKVTDWLALANSEPPSDIHLMEHIARIHADFERIHPFRDGNGRSGRLTMNLVLVRRGYAPAIVYKRDRVRYLRALERTDQAEFGPLAELVARAAKDSLDRFLLPALAGPLQMLPLSALTRKGLTALALRRAAEKGRLQAQRRATGWYSTKTWVERYARSRRASRARG